MKIADCKSIFLYVVIFSLLMAGCPGVYATVVPSLCKITHPSDGNIENECRILKRGETLEGLFGDRWEDVARFNRIDRRHIYPGVHIKVPKKLDDIVNFTPMPKYYQPAESNPKFILIDLSEQFLGAYEYGRLVFSAPISTGEGEEDKETPAGEFAISAFDSRHVSSVYYVEKTTKLYPMHYGLLFHINKQGVAFWLHGRDVPGFPRSHGCIGLYDEEMQKQFYGYPGTPLLEDAKTLFEWVISPLSDDGKYHLINGPAVLIIGHAPAVVSGKHK